MDKSSVTQIEQGLATAFIDGTVVSNYQYRPQFVFNNYKEGQKVLSSIEEELIECESFSISVAFVTMGGITPLLGVLKELEKKGIHGRILTTDYLNFSQPEALDKIASLKNIDLRMYHSKMENDGFHTKGYIFKRNGIYRMIIGSSNMTAKALMVNKEWNTKLISTEKGEFAKELLEEYEKLWNSKNTEEYKKFIEEYRTRYKFIQKQKKIAKSAEIPTVEQYRLQPNKMQIQFINKLQELIDKGEKRALLISATGTGKTYASAFALRQNNPHKALFLVHREQIAKQAMESYKNVFGNTKIMGLLSGNSKDYGADYLFSTMQMMAKDETLNHFEKDDFEFIIVDEVHRAGAESYQKILDYFNPKFLLGMTASPERSDNYDIFALFDHNIAYEIRLQQALEEDLLCPFHYFGITDLEINGMVFDDNSGVRNFTNLVCDERVDYIIQQTEYYGYSGDHVKGLVFCSRKDEAEELSEKFNKRGYRTTVLTGNDSQSRREECIELLTNDLKEDYLDYIFTIDIFNEGVDIPEINQVIMLRPTESPIVFVQQLGRGLRKAHNKEYVVVLDFIGNYMNNFMIPIALSGDRTYNKDNIRKYVREGSRIIPGSSTIHFDEVSKKRIFQSIDTAKTNSIKLLKESYLKLKNKIGHIPTIRDFENYAEIDIMKFFEKFGSYYAFLVKYEKEYKIRLTKEEENIIEYLSKKISKGKRIHELEILKGLITKRKIRIMYYFKNFMKNEYDIDISEQEQESVILNLTNKFAKEEERKKYKNCVFIKQNEVGDYEIDRQFEKLLDNSIFVQMVLEIIDLGIERYHKNYFKRYMDTNFQLYQKYTYEDVCRLLNWKKNMNAQNIGGYFYDSSTKTLPVFINYEKSEDAIAYEDRFISDNELIALSKHPRKVTSSDADHIYKRTKEDKDNRIFLFVRKNKDDKEAKEFYFLGEIFPVGEPKEVHMESTNDDAFEVTYCLDVPVRKDIYDYIKGE
ncbi:MAG: DEAD/DEAH box helicase [Lachnospiraceae bacterium]|nr:DEAD/DEAH box helicase [Lachnospiraceae bacterium]